MNPLRAPEVVIKMTEMLDTIEDMKTDQMIGPNEEITDQIVRKRETTAEMIAIGEDMDPEVKVGVEVGAEKDFHRHPVPDETTKWLLKRSRQSIKW